LLLHHPCHGRYQWSHIFKCLALRFAWDLELGAWDFARQVR
jgi:hypothetical protein